MENQRRNRVKGIIRSLNVERRQQKKKIDILCNDILAAQKNFIERLTHYNFILDFYESVIGQANLKKLILSAGQKIKETVPACSVGIYTLESGGFEFYTDKNSDEIIGLFTPQLAEAVARCNAVSYSNDLFALGLEGNLTLLSQVNICTIPISGFGSAVGFILLWTKSSNNFHQSDIDNLRSICPCLAKALRACAQSHQPAKKVHI